MGKSTVVHVSDKGFMYRTRVNLTSAILYKERYVVMY